MMRLLRREWGAITFVATVLIGAVVVAHLVRSSVPDTGGTAPTPPPCPSYTPWQTPLAGATADGDALRLLQLLAARPPSRRRA